MSILSNFRKNISLVRDKIADIEKKRIAPSSRKTDSLLFSKRKETYSLTNAENAVKKLNEDAWKLIALSNNKINRKEILSLLNNVIKLDEYYSNHNLIKSKEILDKIEMSSLKRSYQYPSSRWKTIFGWFRACVPNR